MSVDYFIHASSYVDEGCEIGAGTNEVMILIIAKSLLKDLRD